MPLTVTTTPLLSPDSVLVLLVDLALLLVTARLLALAAGRIGMPAVAGELVAGVLLGPSVLGGLAGPLSRWLLPATHPEQLHLLDAVGQLGVLLLVGVTGTHLDLKLLRRRRRAAATISLSGLLVPLLGGVSLGLLLPLPLLAGPAAGRGTFAAFLGVALCLSAIPVMAKTLSDMRLIHRDVGQLALAAGMIDDAVGWFLLSIVSAAVTVGLSAGRFTVSLLCAVGFVLFAALLGPRLVRPLLRRAAASDDNGPLVASSVIVLLLGAVTTAALGLEPIFGAFVAGLLIAGSGVDRARLAGLRTVVLAVLAPIFLATAGLRVDLGSLASPQLALAGVAVLAVAVVGKFAGAYLGASLGGLSRWEGLAIGAGMNARGVVEVVVALTGLRLHILNTASYTIVVLVAIVTSLMAPPLLRLAMGRVEHNEDELLRRLEHSAWSGQPARSTEETPHLDAASRLDPAP